jgi:hypothetical protein
LSQNTKSNVSHLLKAVLIGGLFAVLTLAALVTFLIAVSADEGPNSLIATFSALATIGLSLATLWATGFWGRWGLAIFFALAPVILILDFTINPFFPVGTILAAGLLYGAFRRVDEANSQ